MRALRTLPRLVPASTALLRSPGNDGAVRWEEAPFFRRRLLIHGTAGPRGGVAVWDPRKEER